MNSTLRFAALLSAGGGFLNSYAWVAHGHVFTNAQTGNIILFGVFAAQDEWRQALRHVPPMLAFFPGVFTAQWLHKRRFSDDQVRATGVRVCGEVVILTIVGVLSPALPDTVSVAAIAFAATMQSSGFQRVGKWPYTSVVTTANSRSLGETLFAITFLPHNPEASDEPEPWRLSAHSLSAVRSLARRSPYFSESPRSYSRSSSSPWRLYPSSGRSMGVHKQALPDPPLRRCITWRRVGGEDHFWPSRGADAREGWRSSILINAQ